MRKIIGIVGLLTSILLFACTPYHGNYAVSPYSNVFLSKKVQYDFRKIRQAARTGTVCFEDGRWTFSDAAIRRLNILSQVLIYRLSAYCHLDPKVYNIHVFIGKKQYNSCYQYYNSLGMKYMFGDCNQCSKNVLNCEMCNQFIASIPKKSFDNPVTTHGFGNGSESVLVDTFNLKNGDPVYLGLSIRN